MTLTEELKEYGIEDKKISQVMAILKIKRRHLPGDGALLLLYQNRRIVSRVRVWSPADRTTGGEGNDKEQNKKKFSHAHPR